MALRIPRAAGPDSDNPIFCDDFCRLVVPINC
jgi:hypothetical protein